MKAFLLIIPFIVLAAAGARAAEYSLTITKALEHQFRQVEYFIWLPDGVDVIQGVIIHQHGCGDPASEGGRTAHLDPQWRALAQAHDYALIGSVYKHRNQCMDWCDPANGSEDAFFEALGRFAAMSGHDELVDAPWVLWGHSGGGYWVYHMALRHPERMRALALQSPARLEASEIALDMPILCLLGIRESFDRFSGLWIDAIDVLKQRRQLGGLVCIAPDPQSSHDCRHSRSLAIPFIHTILSKKSEVAYDPRYGDLNSLSVSDDFEQHSDNPHAVWLPSPRFAQRWQDFVKTGWTEDDTPPRIAPFNLAARKMDDGAVELKWEAFADLESGIHSFKVYCNGEFIAELKGEVSERNPEGHFLTNGYHDTPPSDQPAMRIVVETPSDDAANRFQVSLVNRAGMESPKSEAVTIVTE